MSKKKEKNTEKPIDLINSELTLVDVGAGGNTDDGRCFYRFTPKVITVLQRDTKVVIALSSLTPDQFTLHDFYTTDCTQQIYDIKISVDKRSLSFKHRNTEKRLINLLLQLYDNKSKTIINCDPQVANRPPVSGDS